MFGSTFFMSIISKLLAFAGVKNEDELTGEELQTLQRYKVILKGEVTVQSIKEFCQVQLKIIEGKFAGPDSTHDQYHKALMHIYLNLIRMIEAPEAEREKLEKHLEELIHKRNG